jgi:putative transposase
MGGKRIRGRKRTLVVDTSGLLLRVLVHPTDIQDSEGAEWWLSEHRHTSLSLQHLWVDQGYKHWIVTRANQVYGLTLGQVTRAPDTVGFVVQPRRWVVERLIAWLNRNRRRSLDYECLPECSETTVYFASIHLMLKRLVPTT